MTDILNFIKAFLDPTTVAGAIVYALLFLGLALLGSSLSGLFMRKSAKRLHNAMAANFVIQLVQVGVFLAAIILYAQLIPALRSLGTAILAGVSVVSVILGLAAQATLGNLIAGVSLLLYRPFHIGDRIQLNAPNNRLVTGVVESLTLGHTILRDTGNEQIIVPNSVMISVVIIRLPPQGQG
jgi:small-conductance mechanosensitive channel